MDPIANMFAQLKNSMYAGKPTAMVNYSKINLAILDVLKNKGYIKNYKEIQEENKKYPRIIVEYKTISNDYAFKDIRRISRPGRRVYTGTGKIYQLLRGKEDIILSTPKGVMSGIDAKKQGLGGEVLGEVM